MFGISKPQIEVTVYPGKESQRRLTLNKSFRIGRARTCDVHIDDIVVSAYHTEILFENGKWWIHDLHSTNGTFLDGEVISKRLLIDRATIQLGKGGPIVALKVKEEEPLQKHGTLLGTIFRAAPSSTQVFQHYFAKDSSKGIGQYTMYLRGAIDRAVKRRGRKFFAVIALLALIATAALGMVWFQHQRLSRLEPLGSEIFYSMKGLELEIARLTEVLEHSSDSTITAEVIQLKERYARLENQYDTFIGELGIYGENGDPKEQLILRIARVFGECELDMPPDFVSEVKRYIRLWQSSVRLQSAIGRSHAYSYPDQIIKSLLEQNLVPQFMYIALQESDFDVNKVGPKTRHGIAKGMWQFIPQTAKAYGLKIGPLRRVRRVDSKDERHNFEKSTQAAAQMLRDLYKTKAQGSGLLVLASYNWGVGNVRKMIDAMPLNPRERNFWNLVRRHKIPKQTYDFVFYVIAAAVIGENPALFGFPFSNPLENVS